MNVLPEQVISKRENIEELLAEEHYKEISELYNNTEGRSSNEKIEKIFAKIEANKEENINIMSIHKSKGLEAEHVFMVGLVDGIIPNNKKGANNVIEEQRRLFYVGMTRTKKQLYLLSNFLLPIKYVKRVDEGKFKYDPKVKNYKGKASSFIAELNLP